MSHRPILVRALSFLVMLAMASPLAAAEPASTSPEPSRFPYPIEVVDLENGLRMVLVPMPTPGVVNLQTIVRAGSRDELEPGRTGYAHFFEHMMFRGTENYPEGEYSRVMAMLGADGNASTDMDFTNYFMTVPASGLAKVLEIEADRFRNLRYTQEQFRKEAGAVLGEFAIGKADPEMLRMDTRLALAFRRHPYGHSVMGYEADVRAMPEGYAYSLQFYDRFYKPEYCTLIIAGDFDPAAVEGLVRTHYAGWARGEYAPSFPEEAPLAAAVRKDLDWKGVTRPVLEVSFRTPGYDDATGASVALELIREVYFSRTSSLYRELVDERGLAEDLEASFPLTRDPFLFTITTRLKKPSDFDAVHERILAAITEAGESPITPERLRAAQRHLLANLALSLEAPSGVGWRLTDFIGATGDPRSIERYFGRMNALTPEEMRSAARTWLDPKRAITITLKGEEGRS